MKLIMHIVLYKIRNNTHKIFPLFQCSFAITYCSIVGLSYGSKLYGKIRLKVVKHIFPRNDIKKSSKYLLVDAQKKI